MSEDEQAAALSEQVTERADEDGLVVILARAAGVGRGLEELWEGLMPGRAAVRSYPLPRGTEESSRAREDLVTAVHLARSRRQLFADATINSALDTYISQQPAPYGDTLSAHDSDPEGIAVPCALAVRESDPSRQMFVSNPAKWSRSEIARRAAWDQQAGRYPTAAIAAEAQRWTGGGSYDPRRRIDRPPLRPGGAFF